MYAHDEVARQREVRAAALAARPVLEELAEAGYRTDSISHLSNSYADLRSAAPILLKHLTKRYPDLLLSAIARALLSAGTKPYRAQLVELLLSKRRFPSEVKFLIACGVDQSTTASNLSETVALLRRRELGECRIGLLGSLRRRRRRPELASVIEKLRADADLAREIATWRAKS
jgi:hypothetical protein